MTALMIAVVGIAVAVVLMSDPIMRSFRVVLLLTGACVVGVVFFLIAGPVLNDSLIASVVIGFIALLPVLAAIPIAERAGPLLSALEPEDLSEHYFIHRSREALRSAEGGRGEEAVLRELEQRPVPHPAWAPVRAALIAQVAQVREMARGQSPGSLDAVKRTRAEMMAAWQAAIHVRTRFFR